MWRFGIRQEGVPLTESLIRVPIDLCALRPAGHQVFNGETVQLLVIAQRSNDVPAQAVDVDPATGDPVVFWPGEELVQTVIVEGIGLYFVCGEVGHGNIAGLVQMIESSSIFFVLCVDTRLCTGFLPGRTCGGLVVSNRVGACDATAQIRVYGRAAVWGEELVDVGLSGSGCCRSRRASSTAASMGPIQLGIEAEVAG
jgi:hypothetical protein